MTVNPVVNVVVNICQVMFVEIAKGRLVPSQGASDEVLFG
jgi:hypothetical protein